MSAQAQQENRLGIEDVPGEISRIFFGGGVQGSRPSYSDSYQPPSSGLSPGGSLYRGICG